MNDRPSSRRPFLKRSTARAATNHRDMSQRILGRTGEAACQP